MDDSGKRIVNKYNPLKQYIPKKLVNIRIIRILFFTTKGESIISLKNTFLVKVLKSVYFMFDLKKDMVAILKLF